MATKAKAKSLPSLKRLEKDYLDAKETDTSKGKVYQSARNAYTDELKRQLEDSPDSPDSTRIDYLDKRIQILQFDEEINEVFDSSKGLTSSELLKFVPFQETKQERDAKKSVIDKSGENVYDLFVTIPMEEAKGEGAEAEAKGEKQGVYAGILSFDDEAKNDTSTFEKKKEASGEGFAKDASFLSPFALYKIWIQEDNSYTLLRTLLSFLGEGKLKELDSILVNQFNVYDAKRKSTTGERETTTGTGTGSRQSLRLAEKAAKAAAKGNGKGGGRRTPRRRHLKQGGRNTKKRPRASQ